MTAVGAGRATRLAGRVGRLPVGGLVGLMQQARRLGAVDLAVGTPGAPVPAPGLIEAGVAELRTGSQQYEDPAGNAQLRAVLADRLGPVTDPDTELTITVGASEGLCLALLATVDPGDEVVVLEPFYENFLGAIALCGGVPRLVRLRAPDWRWDPDELAGAFGPRTRAVLVNSPGNPTGHVLGPAELAELAGLAQRWDAVVVSDETYATYAFDGRRHVCAAEVEQLRNRSIVVGSLSKSHAISGWRLGYLRAHPALTTALRALHVATTGGTAGPLQRAAARAAAAPTADAVRIMAQRRDQAVSIFERLDFDCAAPEGGCYLMAGIERLTDTGSVEFSRELLHRAGVLTVPAGIFYGDPGAGDRHVRIAFNRPADVLAEADRRLQEALCRR